jgi:hypothetical protein
VVGRYHGLAYFLVLTSNNPASFVISW